MDGYLLFSHGSLLCGAGQSLDEHAERLRTRLNAPVEIGYLNYSEPAVEAGVARLVAMGASRIIVVPYFLVPGYFVSKSLPDRLAQVAESYPSIEFLIAPALGVDVLLADALIAAAQDTRPPATESAEVYAVAAAFCRKRPDCPLYGTEHCPAHPPSAPSRQSGREG